MISCSNLALHSLQYPALILAPLALAGFPYLLVQYTDD